MAPEAVVFDIGQVLITWDPEAFYDKVIGRERREPLFAEVDLHAANAAVDRGARWHPTFAALAERHPHWAGEIMMWHDRWIEITTPVNDHSVRLLRALRRNGIPVLALTNFGVEPLARARDRYDFLSEFDAAVVSSEVGVTKPDPAIYGHLERLSGLDGDRLLYTDDLPANIAGADARGWRTHLFTGAAGWAGRLIAEGLLNPGDAR